MLYFVLTIVLFALSFIAGMMRLGVAFIATPVLGLFGFELKHVIMPWSLCAMPRMATIKGGQPC